MAGWLNRLFGNEDNSPMQMPGVGRPSMFGKPAGQLNAAPGQVSMTPNSGAPTPAPVPKPKGTATKRPGAPTDPGPTTLPQSYTDMLGAGVDPESDPEQIGPGFMQGFETDEEGDMQGLHRPEDPETFMLGADAEPPMDIDEMESPMQGMAQSSMIRDVDPEEGFVAGENGIMDAIHKAMQGFKQKQVAPTGINAGNDQTSMFPKDLVENLPMSSQITPDLEPLVSENSGGWGDGSAPMLRGMGTVASQTPNINKQNLFKALMSRLS